MPQVVSLYRYPVKGFTPERRESLLVQADGRVAGDRVLAFRFADAVTPEEEGGLDYWPKAKGLALQDFPALAALTLSYEQTGSDGSAEQKLRITCGAEVLVEDGLDAAGRGRIAEAVTEYVLTTPEGTRLQRPGRLPLVLVGDGVASRFQDEPRGYVSLHGRESASALENALGNKVDDRRFRSNVVIVGFDAWQELEWHEEVRIGDVPFTVEGPIVRCLATHANPDTGVRDAKVLTTLTRGIGQQQPTLGRLLLPQAGEGTIRVGDEVTAS